MQQDEAYDELVIQSEGSYLTQKTGQDGSDKFFEETLSCPVCFNLVTDPHDCLQCDQTLCGTCKSRVRNCCPQCRHNGFKKGHKLVRQLLN